MISIRQAIIDGDAGASLGDAATFLECLVRKFADESAVLNIGVAFFHFFSGFAANHLLRSCSTFDIQFRKEICTNPRDSRLQDRPSTFGSRPTAFASRDSEKKRAACDYRFIDLTFCNRSPLTSRKSERKTSRYLKRVVSLHPGDYVRPVVNLCCDARYFHAT
jgi:hypothetical protein